MLIIADSSALVALATCEAIEFLDQLEFEIKVPKAVFDEVTLEGKPYATELRAFLEDRVETTQTNLAKFNIPSIGKGELEAMTLYQQLAADWLLIDDRLARRVAENHGIACIGALGLLLQLKKKGIIQEISPFINALRASPIHYGEALLQRVLKLASE